MRSPVESAASNAARTVSSGSVSKFLTSLLVRPVLLILDSEGGMSERRGGDSPEDRARGQRDTTSLVASTSQTDRAAVAANVRQIATDLTRREDVAFTSSPWDPG